MSQPFLTALAASLVAWIIVLTLAIAAMLLINRRRRRK